MEQISEDSLVELQKKPEPMSQPAPDWCVRRRPQTRDDLLNRPSRQESRVPEIYQGWSEPF